MKTINYRINTDIDRMSLDDKSKNISIQEYENNATTLVFNFDRPIKETDRLSVMITNNNRSKAYRLVRLAANKYSVELPREILVRGRLLFTIHHYDQDYLSLNKYSPETHLYITAGLDITNDTMDSRPDLIAEMFYRIEQLEKNQKS